VVVSAQLRRWSSSSIILRSRVMGTSYDPTTYLNQQATTAPFVPREASAAERLRSKSPYR
jgi:hypothetical protein